MVSKKTVKWVGTERRQSRIEAKPRRAVGTQDRVRLAHIDVDVWVVLRWGLADTHEFLHSDADFRDAVVVPELRIAAARYRHINSDRCNWWGSGQFAAPVRGMVSFCDHDVLVVSCRPNRPSKRRQRSARRCETSSRPDRTGRPRTDRDVGRNQRTPALAGRRAPCLWRARR